MRDRKGDWRDVLSAWSLALDAKKVWMGFLGVIATLLVMMGASVAYGWLVKSGEVASFASPAGGHAMEPFLGGEGLAAAAMLLTLLNPFHAGLGHFCFSAVFYGVLFLFWSYFAGTITRLAALEYGRDDLPTLREGTGMVRSHWKSYLLAPMSPLIGLVIFVLLDSLGALVGSIPYVGPILMIVGIIPWFIATIIAVFLAVLGVLSFGLMFPAISMGGKDAFEGWSSAFSYVLWGFNRWFCYTLLAAVIGAISTVAAWGVCELFIYFLVRAIDFGMIGDQVLVTYNTVEGAIVPTLGLTHSNSALMQISSFCMLVALLGVRAIPIAYLFSYFFTANTVICLLLRKDVDRIEIDEVYDEEAEEEDFTMPEPEGVEEEEEEVAEGVEEEATEEPKELAEKREAPTKEAEDTEEDSTDEEADSPEDEEEGD